MTSIIIDHHVHLGKDCNKTGYSLSKEQLISDMDYNCIDKSVVFACPNILPSKENPYRKENELILSAAQKNNRLIPFMFIHPFLDKVEYIQSNQHYFAGFKIYCSAKEMEYQYQDMPNTEIFRYLNGIDKPLIAHIGMHEGERAKNIINTIELYKGPVIITHAARFFDQDLKNISILKNVYLDVSPLNVMLTNKKYLPNISEINSKIADFSEINTLNYLKGLFEERIIWGTDNPWCNFICEDGYSKEVELYRRLNLEQICHNFF